MKTTPSKHAARICSLIAAIGFLAHAASAQTGGDKIFPGDGRTDWGGPVGMGTLELSDDTTNVTGKFTITQGDPGGGGGGNVLVIYLQAGTNAGFTTTSGFADPSDGIHKAISGNDPSNGRSTLNFMSGFTPNYAIGIQLNNFSGLYGLANGSSLNYVQSVNLTPNNVTGIGTYTFSFPLSAVGMTNGTAVVGQTIKLMGTLISASAYRSPEAIAGNTDGTSGWNTTAQTAFGSYLVGELPIVTYPVTFQVDMTACANTGIFNPGGGDQVVVSGTFNGNTNLVLTASSNPNIYTATYNDANSPGSTETYHYTILPQAGGSDPESTDPRSFILASSQTLPVIYFSSFAPSANTTVPLTFSVNMAAQLEAGNFNPGNGDQVYVGGSFSQNAALVWVLGAPLTESLTNTNVYVGTFGDGNYTGTLCQYKFIYNSSSLSKNVYESTPNRDYNTPASAETFPTVYFDNETNATLVTFSVDMSTQINFNEFTPGSDTVAVAGSFTGWAGGAIACTATAGNTNIYSVTIPIFDPPGTVEQFKYITYGTGINGTDYEQPAASTPTMAGNRYFTLPSSSTNLPLVAFSDQFISDILLSNVTVTFTVDMTNAVGTDGTTWPSEVTGVYMNGTFLPSGGFASTWNTSLPQMTQNPNGSSLYTYTTTINAGQPVVVSYKYGMNGNDDEAGFAQNHTRYVRGYGTYNFPVDTFGSQAVGPAFGVEPSFGSLAIGAPSGGRIPLTWLGRPGVHLQTRTNLTSGSWIDHPETDALSSTNWPITGVSQYFRLIHPE